MVRGRRVAAACLLFKQGPGPTNKKQKKKEKKKTKILPASPDSTPRDGISRSRAPLSL